MKLEELKLTQDWDKTFPRSDKVNHSKVTFINRYGITLAADLYIPKGAVHTDLYDGGGKGAIPFDKLQHFFAEYLR